MPPTMMTPSAATFPMVQTRAMRPEARTLKMLTAATNTAETNDVRKYDETSLLLEEVGWSLTENSSSQRLADRLWSRPTTVIENQRDGVLRTRQTNNGDSCAKHATSLTR